MQASRCGVRSLCLVLLAGLLSARIAAQVPTSRACRAVRADVPPVLDGRLEEPFWENASACSDFEVLGGEGRRVRDTIFRIAYDDAWLYLAVDCSAPSLNALEPLIQGHDAGACNDESIELFLDPGTGGRLYFHYMLSYANARDERRIYGEKRDLLWDVPWRSAVDVREDGWAGEIAVPLYVLASHGRLQDFRLNVTRNHRVPVIDAQNVVVEENRELSSWAQVEKGFHEPDRFLPLTGITDVKLRVPPLARITSAEVCPYYVKDGASYYDVTATLRAYNQQPGALEISVDDHPVLGDPHRITRPVSVRDGRPVELTVAIPAAALCSRTVTLRLRNPERAEELETVAVDPSALNVMTVFLDRNYYTTEQNAFAICSIGLPSEALERMVLKTHSPEGALLGAQENLAGTSEVPIALSKLPLGTTRVAVTLGEKQGDVFFETDVSVLKRTPKPGLEWKIDQRRRIVLNNGEPFVPFGVVMSGVKPEHLHAYRELVDNNFNTFMVWCRTTPEGLAEYQKNAAEQGLFVVSHPDECVQNIEWDCYERYSGKLLAQVKRATRRQSLISLKSVLGLPIPISERNAIYGEFYNKNIDRCLKGVELTREFPNLTSYFILDEPMSAKHFDQYKFGQDYYARVHRADGYHPVAVNYSSTIPEGDEYVNWCDILMTDPYWSPPAAQNTRSTPNHVSKVCWTTNQRALAHRQAVWEILVGPLWSGCRKRPLNHRELRCQTYLSLIHKATGIFYFSYEWVRPATWATFRQLGAEVKVLTPFIAGPPTQTTISYRKAFLDRPDEEPQFRDAPFDPPREEYPDVQAATLADAKGGCMLLAANTRHFPVACVFAVPGLTAVTSAFSEGTATMGGEAFVDRLEPYATRAYRLTMADGLAPQAITVSQTVLKRDLPNPETSLPLACRADRKNLLPNPSFEEENTASWPDYCRVSRHVATHETGALFGRKCLRFQVADAGRYEFMQMICAPQVDRPTTHTFSLYMKGSRKGMRAWVRATHLNPEKDYGEHKTIELSTSWERYSLTGTLPAKVDDGSSMFEVRLLDPGVMWIDGLQLERGGQATEYEE